VSLKELPNNFTGFLAEYKNGNTILEKNNYYSNKLKKKCATNWAEIDKSQLVALTMYWHGIAKVEISIEEYPDLNRDDWFFSHYGYYDMANRKTLVIARNIGLKMSDHLRVYSVSEETGDIKIEARPI